MTAEEVRERFKIKSVQISSIRVICVLFE